MVAHSLWEMSRSSNREPGLVETARHEAGHAVAYWHHGWHFRYVTMRPSAENIHACVRMHGRRVSNTPAKLITTMECAAAGRIAQLLMTSDAAGDQLLKQEFERIARLASLDSYEDVDMREFVGAGRALDWYAVRKTGADGWLEIWHDAESKIRGQLWPAVMAVAAELMISSRRLTYREISVIASAALPASPAAGEG
jgi:hypothetical protein